MRSATQLEGDSLRNQLEAAIRYARDRGMRIVRIYCDECGSGLRTDNRPGLGQLLRDLESGNDDFDALLLLDPSRWSRALDPKHIRFLEQRCRGAGVEVHYCAERLSKDETPISAVVKAVKRYMIREYSRGPADATQARTPLCKVAIAVGRHRSAAARRAGQNAIPDDVSGGDDARLSPD